MREDFESRTADVPLLGVLFDEYMKIIETNGLPSAAADEYVRAHHDDHHDFPKMAKVLEESLRESDRKWTHDDLLAEAAMSEAIEGYFEGDAWKFDQFLLEYDGDRLMCNMARLKLMLRKAVEEHGWRIPRPERDDESDDAGDEWKKGKDRLDD